MDTTTTLMKMELLRMKHARALCSMRADSEIFAHTVSAGYSTTAQRALNRIGEHEASAKQAEADLEKLIAESKTVTKS